MHWLMLLAAASAAQDAGGLAGDPGKQVRCVREDVIGSLAAKRKVCHTQEEWRRIRNNNNDEARRVFQPGNFNCNGSASC